MSRNTQSLQDTGNYEPSKGSHSRLLTTLPTKPRVAGHATQGDPRVSSLPSRLPATKSQAGASQHLAYLERASLEACSKPDPTLRVDTCMCFRVFPPRTDPPPTPLPPTPGHTLILRRRRRFAPSSSVLAVAVHEVGHLVYGGYDDSVPCLVGSGHDGVIRRPRQRCVGRTLAGTTDRSLPASRVHQRAQGLGHHGTDTMGVGKCRTTSKLPCPSE